MEIQELLDQGEAALIQAKSRDEGESLVLDFKSNGRGSESMFVDGRLAKAGRQSLGKAISAFSNSAGGLIVIGVDCRREKGIDRIVELAPIANLRSCFASLQGALGELVQPKHDGLRVHSLSASAEDQGYLVLEVPRSERRPHMSQADRLYYKRSGTSSFPMEHYDIEDAFRRQEAPLLSMSNKLERGATTNEHLVLRLQLFLTNQGRRTARHPEFAVKRRVGIPAVVPMVYGSDDFQIRTIDGHVSISAPSHIVINPGATIPFHHFEFNLRCIGGHGLVVQDIDWNSARLAIEYELRAEDTWPVDGILTIERRDLAPFRHQVPGYRGN